MHPDINTNRSSFVTMTQNDINEYIRTIKPILFLLRITGVLPFPPIKKDGLPKFMTCKITWTIAMAIYLFNVAVTWDYVFEQLYYLSNNYSLKQLVLTILRLISKTIVITVPINMWNKTKELSNYWTKWKELQNLYEEISEEIFVSRIKNQVKWATLICISLSLWSQLIGQVYLYHGTFTVIYLSEHMVYFIVYLVGTYWLANCLYIRSVAGNIIDLGENIITKGEDQRKLYKVFDLWLKLCELSDEFNKSHSLLFFFYFNNVNVAFIFFAYITINNSTYEDTVNRLMQATALFICASMIYMICETAYSVYERINRKPKEMLLRENTMHLNKNMLQTVSFFLQMTHVREPEISLNGLVVLNRSLFPTIWATGINYLIVLRQFSST